MTLYRPRYLVEYHPDQPPLEVSISSGDMMRAELEAAKQKLPEKTPFHTTALWLWSALVRSGDEQRTAREFVADPPEWEPVKRDDGTGEGATETVDPTTAGHGGSASDAPASTVPPVSG